MDSILNSIKKLLGVEESYTYFDSDIIVGINTALNTLVQIGIGPSDGFSITGNSEVWTDFVDNIRQIEIVKSYVHLKTKLLFDPPMSSAVIEIYNKQISEYEFRILTFVEGSFQED